MKTKIIKIVLLSVFSLTSCKKHKQEKVEGNLETVTRTKAKAGDLALKKQTDILFEDKDSIVEIETTNKNKTLNLEFNNSNGTVRVYLNGGKEIKLKEKKSASGIWYDNKEYELSGKGNHYQLKKGKEILFRN